MIATNLRVTLIMFHCKQQGVNFDKILFVLVVNISHIEKILITY